MTKNQKISRDEAAPLFRKHVQSAMRALRDALAELLDSVGADPTKPQDMSRQFGLNKNLTWKISRILCEEDPCAAIPHIPGKSGLNIFIQSLRDAGAPKKAVEAVHEAANGFEDMVEVHAGDRATLEMMLGELTREGEQQRSEAHRKNAFLGNSAIWGIQARVQLTTNIIAPSEVQDKVDLGWLCGLVDFRRLREDVPWAVASARKFETNGTELAVGSIESIDVRFAGKDDVPLMGDFCSQPLPETRSVPLSEGMLRYELVEGPVGKTAAATAVVGLYGRAFITRYRYGTNTLGEHIARLSTPAELLIHDLFVHRDLEYAMAPGIWLYSQLPGGPVYPEAGRDRGLLPVHERVIKLGRGLAGVMTPEIPRYKQMLKAVHKRLRWNADEFHGFRFKMRFPPVPSLAVLRYDLIERP